MNNPTPLAELPELIIKSRGCYNGGFAALVIEGKEYTLAQIEAALTAHHAAGVDEPQTGSWIAADDVYRMARDIDVALNGEDGAAKRPALCDVTSQILAEARKLGRPLLAAQSAGQEAVDVSELIASLTEALDDARTISGSAVLSGDKHGKDDKGILYSKACLVGNAIECAIDDIRRLTTPTAGVAVTEAELAEVIQQYTGCGDSDSVHAAIAVRAALEKGR